MKALGKVLRFLMMTLGGAILALALLLFFAWLLFPRDFVRDLPEKALSRALPQWQWQIGSAHYDWPLALRLEQVQARPRGTEAGAVEALFLDRLRLQPDLFFFLRERQWRGSFTAELAGGSIRGSGTVHNESGQQDLFVSATVDAVDLRALGWLSQMLERQVQGRLSGTLDTGLALKSGRLADLRAKLQVADGLIPLRNPVLGHSQLPFSTLSLQLEQEAQELQVKNGVLNSPLCTGEFAGRVELARPLAASLVSVRGVLQARPELFQHVRDQQDLQALRLQAARGPLYVMLSGTLNDPALAFEREALPVPPARPNLEQGPTP